MKLGWTENVPLDDALTSATATDGRNYLLGRFDDSNLEDDRLASNGRPYRNEESLREARARDRIEEVDEVEEEEEERTGD